MTTQANSSSPFIDNSNSIPKDLPTDSSEGFSIHTMHDDLISLQKGEMLTGTPIEIVSPSPQLDVKPQSTASTVSFQPPVTEKSSLEKSTNASVTPIKKDFSTLVEVPMPEKSKTSPSVLYKILLGVIVFFVVAIIGLGVYYFFLSNKRIVQAPVETPVTTPPVEAPAPPVETPIAIPVEKYSNITPNYLSFDPANETLTDLNKTLASIAAELKNKNPQSIYEFFVVDSNNNPVVLPIFAAATKFNLPPTLLKSLGETFSIFFYNDAGNIRLAIATTIKDKKTVAAEMLKKEATLVSDTAFLFIEPSATKNPVIKFSTGNYNGLPVRYFNFDLSLSVDYILSDSSLIIGTSKNTARAVVDKLSSAATISSPASVQATPAITTSEGVSSSQCSSQKGMVSDKCASGYNDLGVLNDQLDQNGQKSSKNHCCVSVAQPIISSRTSMTLNECLNQGGSSTNQCSANQKNLGYINNITVNNGYPFCCK